MIHGVQPAVVAAVAWIVDEPPSFLWIGIGDDVLKLQIVRSGADRQIVGQSRLPAQNTRNLRNKVLRIPVTDFLT